MYDRIIALSKLFVKLAILPTFNWEVFKDLEPQQIEEYLAFTKIPLVGSGKGGGIGSSRKVYDLGDKVLKIAYNQTGIAQNTMEARIQDSSPYFATVFEMHPKAIWILSEKIKPFKKGEWEIVTGLPANLNEYAELRNIISRLTPEGLEQLRIRFDLEEDAIDTLKQILDLRGKFDLIRGDILEPEHWGRAPDGSMKIFDYGLDTSLFETHYDPTKGTLRDEPAGYGDPEPSESELEALREIEESGPQEIKQITRQINRPQIYATTNYLIKKYNLSS